MLRFVLALGGLLAVALAGCGQPDPMGPQVRNPGSPFQDSDPPRGNYILERDAVVPGMPGILLHGMVFNDGQFHRLQVNATNAGGPPYWVLEGGCHPTWSDTLSREGTVFRPRGHGDAWLDCCAWKAFDPGDSVRASFDWDELMWGDDNRHSPAPPGDYTWAATMPVLRQDQQPDCSETPASARIEFELTTA